MNGSPIGHNREATRGCMGRLRFGQWLWVVVTISIFVFLPACGGHKPPGVSSFPAKINLNPTLSYSMQAGTVIVFTASAQNAANSNVATTFSYASSDPGIVDVGPSGVACAGTWNAPYFTICTPGGTGVAQVTATTDGVTSAPTLVFVHPFIATIKVSVVPPVNSPPPACPSQIALPAACSLPFKATNSCLSQNQIITLQATAYDSQGSDITAAVGPFSWSQGNNGVATLTPIVTASSYNVPTNQATAGPGLPGQSPVIASASGVSSAPYYFETCPVQCIDLQLGVTGSQGGNTSSFAVNKGTSQTVTATAVDVQGCIVPKAPLTWTSSEPAALAAGGTSVSCAPGTTTCTVTTPQPGVSAISASCTPPTCNVGFPLNLGGFPPPYAPQPVYPVTAISGLVTGVPTATSVLATSQDCSSATPTACSVAIYNVSTVTNLPGVPTPLPAPPNSLMFDPPGDKAYMGSENGAIAINPANLGASSPFTSLAAPGSNPLGLVTGKVIAVSRNGNSAVFSDTVSTPNEVYVVVAAPVSTTRLNINSATTAAFSPDGMKTFILGNGGNTLYVYSALQYLQTPISLPTPATAVAFSSTGSFALLSGGGPPSNLALYNTCDNSSVTLPAPGLPTPPMFLRMVPAGNVQMGNGTIPPLQPNGLDFFFGIDNTGIDIIATTSSPGPLTSLCPQVITLAQTTQNTTFAPVHVNIGQGTFHPINFFLSPDSTQAYIIPSDSSRVLVYNFNTNSASAIPLVNNAIPIAADITVDGTLIYVAGSDGLLHEISTSLALDEMEVSFLPLANSTNSFCFTGDNCALNIVAVKP
jgi:hypothetical protein